MKKASDELDKAVDNLRNALFAQTMEEPQASFKTREVYDLIRQQYHGLKKEYEHTFAQKLKIRRQIISPERAMAMAKNIFVRGAYKKLREDIRRYKKAEQRLAQKLIAYSKEEKTFQIRDWKVLPHSSFLQTQYYLTKQRTLLELEKTRLEHIKLELQKKQSELDSLCQTLEAQRKIEEISAGILRKNDKVGTRYRVTKPDTLSNNSLASLIADAILNEPEAVQLVARLDGNFLETEKDWEMMSEFEKDELMRKKIIREL